VRAAEEEALEQIGPGCLRELEVIAAVDLRDDDSYA